MSSHKFFWTLSLYSVIVQYYLMTAHAKKNGFFTYLWAFTESRSSLNSMQGISVAADISSVVLKTTVLLLCGQASVNKYDNCVTWSSNQMSFHSFPFIILLPNTSLG